MDSIPYAVFQDGKALRRGLSRSEAESFANRLATGFEKRCTSGKRRVAEFDVKPDTQLVAEHDANYRWLKENL